MSNPQPPRPRRHTSIFWPLAFIAAGVLALLVNLNVIPLTNLGILIKLWPVLLILIGIDIMLGRRFPFLVMLAELAAVGLAIAVVVYAPRLGWTSSAWSIPAFNFQNNLRTERFTEPIGPAKTAEVNLELSSLPVNLQALEDSSDLIDANVAYFGEMEFTVTGTTAKTVRLNERRGFEPFIEILLDEDEIHRWEIGLSPRLPLDLTVDVGSGSAQMDLSQLKLTALNLDGGSGRVDLTLPASSTRYPVVIDVGSGSLAASLPEKTSLTIALEGGSGSTLFTLPAAVAVQVTVEDGGSGSLHLPDNFKRVQGDTDEDEGVWETPNFDTARQPITITLDIGSGSITLQ